jgi:hypothetical protein
MAFIEAAAAHLRERAQFADQQGIAAGKVDQEQVVLSQIASEGAFGQVPSASWRRKDGPHTVPSRLGLLAQTTINTLGKDRQNHRTS